MSSIPEDEQSPIAGQLFTMGRLIRDICGRDLGNKLLDAIEPIEEEMHVAVRQYAAEERLDELNKAMDEYGYKEGISYSDTPVVTYESIRKRIKQLKGEL